MPTEIKATLGGVAVVCCPHDREKKQITTSEQVARLGMELDPPIRYNPKIHYLFTCACCLNLFVAEDDDPKFCSVCRPDRLVHQLGGPLAEPTPGFKE